MPYKIVYYRCKNPENSGKAEAELSPTNAIGISETRRDRFIALYTLWSAILRNLNILPILFFLYKNISGII